MKQKKKKIGKEEEDEAHPMIMMWRARIIFAQYNTQNGLACEFMGQEFYYIGENTSGAYAIVYVLQQFYDRYNV